jgi:ketosteroid isomerase-like protein
MFLKLFVGLVAVSMLFSSCCQRSTGVDTRPEKAQIQELSNQWTAAIVARDVDKIISMYAADAVQLQGGLEAIAGRDSIRTWYETWVHDPALAYTASTVTIDVASSLDLAYERGTYSFNQTTPHGRFKEVGKYVTIWKAIGGEWKAVLDTGTPDKSVTN